MCGYFCIEYIDFMLAGKTLIDYNSLFLPYDFEKIDNIVLTYFKSEWMQSCWNNWYILKFKWPNKH